MAEDCINLQVYNTIWMTILNMYLLGNLVLTQSNECKVMLLILILIMYLIETASWLSAKSNSLDTIY